MTMLMNSELEAVLAEVKGWVMADADAEMLQPEVREGLAGNGMVEFVRANPEAPAEALYIHGAARGWYGGDLTPAWADLPFATRLSFVLFKEVVTVLDHEFRHEALLNAGYGRRQPVAAALLLREEDSILERHPDPLALVDHAPQAMKDAANATTDSTDGQPAAGEAGHDQEVDAAATAAEATDAPETPADVTDGEQAEPGLEDPAGVTDGEQVEPAVEDPEAVTDGEQVEPELEDPDAVTDGDQVEPAPEDPDAVTDGDHVEPAPEEPTAQRVIAIVPEAPAAKTGKRGKKKG